MYMRDAVMIRLIAVVSMRLSWRSEAADSKGADARLRIGTGRHGPRGASVEH